MDCSKVYTLLTAPEILFFQIIIRNDFIIKANTLPLK